MGSIRSYYLAGLIIKMSAHVFLAAALSTQAAWANPGTQIRAEGLGSIIEGDMAQARDEAIIDAQIRALENAFGAAIDSRTVIQDEQLLDATMTSSSRGRIENYRVINEGPVHNGLYRVMIEAVVVSDDGTDGQPSPAVKNPAVVIELSETGPGASSPKSSIVASGLVRAVAREGYGAILNTDAEQIQTGGRFPAQGCILVRGRSEVLYSQRLGGIVSCRATSYIELVEKGSEILIASCRLQAKGFGLYEHQARRSALEKISRSASSFVVEQLAHYTGTRERIVEINVLGGGNASQLGRLRNLLQSMRWVTRLDEIRRDNGHSLFEVRYAEKIDFLAKRLSGIAWVELAGYTWNTIDLRIIEEEQRERL